MSASRLALARLICMQGGVVLVWPHHLNHLRSSNQDSSNVFVTDAPDAFEVEGRLGQVRDAL